MILLFSLTTISFGFLHLRRVRCDIQIYRAFRQAWLLGNNAVPHFLVWEAGLQKGLGTDNYNCRSNLAPRHARKHEAHPPGVKMEFRPDSNDLGIFLYLSWRKQHGQL